MVYMICHASDCEQEATFPSGFCSKRCYHRDYARKHSEETNAAQRNRYASDSKYREHKQKSGKRYAKSDKGRKKKKERAETERDYYIDYAARNSVQATERARQWRLNNSEKARKLFREATNRRRARKLNQFVEDVDPTIVFKRDKGICEICEKPVDPNRFDIDHIIPLSKGGEHSYANVQLAHPSCNYRKSDKAS